MTCKTGATSDTTLDPWTLDAYLRRLAQLNCLREVGRPVMLPGFLGRAKLKPCPAQLRS